MEVIDLFCGAGGFSKGATLAGARVILGVEADPKIASVYCNNFEHEVRVETLRREDLEQYVKLVKEHPNAHLHGSPPCQKLSQANKTTRDVEEGLNLVKFYLDLVEKAQPKTWSMEQVNDSSLREYLTERGVDFTVVNTRDFDVPQSRKRVVAGSRHIIQGLIGRSGTGPTIVPKDVLPDLIPYERYKLVNGTDNVPVREKQGNRLVTIGHRPKEHDEGARALTTPAHTVWRKPGKVYDTHAKKIDRLLTSRECASLQGFPMDFVLDENSRTRSHQVIGNAVPPPLAKHIIQLTNCWRNK
jgi:DNA (cytosine-5)-methyltransferase 1